MKNYKQKNNQYNQYVYKNDRIIEKIEKMIEENMTKNKTETCMEEKT